VTCLVQAAVGSHCLDCAKAARPDVKTKVRFWNARQPTLVTFALMAINIAVFLYVAAKDPASLGGRSGVTREQFDLGLERVLLPERRARLLPADHVRVPPLRHHPPRLQHAAAVQLGQLLERSLGRVRFGLLYAAGLLGGSCGVLLMGGRGITGGASGAVFGLMAAAASASIVRA
jgi:hypothetical protein